MTWNGMSRNGKIKKLAKASFFYHSILEHMFWRSPGNSDDFYPNCTGSSPDVHLWNKYITKRFFCQYDKCNVFFITIILQDKKGLIPNNTEFVRFESDKKGLNGPPSAEVHTLSILIYEHQLNSRA